MKEVAEALRARSDIERRTTDWVRGGRGTDGLLSGSLLLGVVEALRRGADVGTAEGASADGWALLSANLCQLGLTGPEVDFVGRSLQAALDQEIYRAERELASTPPGPRGCCPEWSPSSNTR
jgi:hypothetical protein